MVLDAWDIAQPRARLRCWWWWWPAVEQAAGAARGILPSVLKALAPVLTGFMLGELSAGGGGGEVRHRADDDRSLAVTGDEISVAFGPLFFLLLRCPSARDLPVLMN